MIPRMNRIVLLCLFAAVLAGQAGATPFYFSTGESDGRMAMASRPGSQSLQEIEAADDFVLDATTQLNHATFTGLLSNATLQQIGNVRIEIYRVFPLDSQEPPSGHVPTRVHSPADVALDSRQASDGGITFSTTMLNPQFTALNSVLNGIFPIPNQHTLGEGPVTGQEIQFDVDFATPFLLPSSHYFFVPQVEILGGNGDFYWLSAARPPLADDFETWIRNANLEPDWLRVGTDIVGGTTYNGCFSLTGEQATTPVPEPSAFLLLLGGFGAVGWIRRRTR